MHEGINNKKKKPIKHTHVEIWDMTSIENPIKWLNDEQTMHLSKTKLHSNSNSIN